MNGTHRDILNSGLRISGCGLRRALFIWAPFPAQPCRLYSPRADEEITPCKLPSSACYALRSHARWTSAPPICRPLRLLARARLEIEPLMSARHAVLSQGAKQAPPHFLAWLETFGRTDPKRCRRSREINDFHLPPAQTPRTLFRDDYGISEIRRHLSSFDADV